MSRPAEAIHRRGRPKPWPTATASPTSCSPTTPHAGTLVVNGNAIPNSGSLVINTGGRVNPSGATETVAALFFGDVQQLAGTWGSSTSTATYKNDTYFTGSGVVLVTVGPEAELPASGDESVSVQSIFDPTQAAFASLALEQEATDGASVKKKRTTLLS